MIDFFIFIILLIFLIFGFVRGFYKELKSFVTLLVGSSLIFQYLTQGKHRYADDFREYLISLFQINDINFPVYLDAIVGCIILYIFVSLVTFIFCKIVFKYSGFVSDMLNHIFFSRVLGSFASLMKGILLITVSIIFIQHYSYFVFFEASLKTHLMNFSENSLFLDYFLNFGVQLQDVWNHWYS